MSKMSQLHAETADRRAASAENEVEFLKGLMRIAADDAGKVADVLHAAINPNSVIGTDLIMRLNRIILGLRMGAGDPVPEPAGEVIDLDEVEF